MAEEAKKRSFPTIPLKHWWALRDRFKQSIPGTVTDSYVATVLNMQANSARANILPGLKLVGVIEQDEKPSEMAKRWRDDAQYPAVCGEIRTNVYPQELIDAVTNPVSDRGAVERWFAHETGAGRAAVGKMAAFYCMICEADASKAEVAPKSEERKTRRAAKPRAPEVRDTPASQRKVAGASEPDDGGQHPPAIHINLQIHVSSDASPDQIDQIFAGIAKHIYQRK